MHAINNVSCSCYWYLPLLLKPSRSQTQNTPRSFELGIIRVFKGKKEIPNHKDIICKKHQITHHNFGWFSMNELKWQHVTPTTSLFPLPQAPWAGGLCGLEAGQRRQEATNIQRSWVDRHLGLKECPGMRKVSPLKMTWMSCVKIRRK